MIGSTSAGRSAVAGNGTASVVHQMTIRERSASTDFMEFARMELSISMAVRVIKERAKSRNDCGGGSRTIMMKRAIPEKKPTLLMVILPPVEDKGKLDCFLTNVFFVTTQRKKNEHR